MVKTNLLVPRDNPDTLGQWAVTLKPDYLGPIASGLYGCLLTWQNEHENPAQDQMIWAFGTGVDAISARAAAINHLVEQRAVHATWELIL